MSQQQSTKNIAKKKKKIALTIVSEYSQQKSNKNTYDLDKGNYKTTLRDILK